MMSGAAAAGPAAPAAPAIAFGPMLNTFQDVARQWPDDVARRLEAAVAQAATARHAVRTADDARAYQRQRREAFWRLAGPLPLAPGTPGVTRSVAYETHGSLSHLGVQIEKVTYESWPGVPVSALLYRVPGPAGAPPRPGVLFVCGHYGTAKQAPEFQRVCLDLALHGMVVLAIDPWGQGERFQFMVPGREGPLVPGGTFEHSYGGLQCYLTGGLVGRYFAWDAVRGVDVLAGLPDVDPARIGATGNSGGGAQTVLLMMADERLAAAMPCTFITGTPDLFRTGQVLDAEMNFPGSLTAGLDHADLLACFAPRPLVVGAARYDFFPIEGTEEAVDEARRIYAALGAADNLILAEDDQRHAYTDRLREQAVRFFTRVLAGTEDFTSHDLPALPEADLAGSPSGQLYRDRPGIRGVHELNREFFAAHPLSPPRTAAEASSRLTRALGPVPALDASPIRPRYFEVRSGDGYDVQQVYFFSQPRVAVAGTLLRPPGQTRPTGPAAPSPDGAARPAWLVLLPDGTASAAAELEEAIALARAGSTVFVFDPRGRGAVTSVAMTNYAPYNSWLGHEGWMSCVEMLMGRTSLATRVYDVRRAVSFLEQFEGTTGVSVRATGIAALWAYLAGALDSRLTTLHLTGMLPSWTEVVETRIFNSDVITAAMVIPGVLQQLDLPDLRQCFAGRDLRVEAPLRVAALPEQLPLRRNA
jgi:cephalosporin-C deacetylase-like acetyl esterase